MCLPTRILFFVFSTIIAWPTLAAAQLSRATALGTIGVGSFADARGKRVESASSALTSAVVARLNARTYLKAKATGSVLSPAEKQNTLKTAIAKAGVDGLLVGEVLEQDVRWSLVGPLGQELAGGKVEMPGLGEKELALTADRIVDNVAASVPYRTFITKEIGPDVYEINMGSAGGFAKGQRLRVFDLEGADFKSKRVETGVVEVVAVQEWTAEVEAVSGFEKIKPFQKIAFEERARGMALPDPVPSRGWAALGGGLLTIASDSPAPAYDNKVYRVNSTPMFMLGLAYRKWELQAGFAQAQNTTEDLIFSEILLDREIWASGKALWNWRVLGGLRVANYMVTSDSVLGSQLESNMGASPRVSATIERYLGGPLSFLLGAEAMPLMYYSKSSSNLLFSYGGGASAGLRFDFSPRIGLDITGRLQTFRRPVDGNSAVQERHSNVNAMLKVRF